MELVVEDVDDDFTVEKYDKPAASPDTQAPTHKGCRRASALDTAIRNSMTDGSASNVTV